MNLLLASLFLFIPVAAHADGLDDLSVNEADSNSIVEPFDAENPDDPNSIANQFALGPYGNPYSPSSATNFEAFKAPRLYGQEGIDRGRWRVKSYDREWISNSYGRYRSPYSPDSFSNRFGAGNPYGRGLRIEGR